MYICKLATVASTLALHDISVYSQFRIGDWLLEDFDEIKLVLVKLKFPCRYIPTSAGKSLPTCGNSILFLIT